MLLFQSKIRLRYFQEAYPNNWSPKNDHLLPFSYQIAQCITFPWCLFQDLNKYAWEFSRHQQSDIINVGYRLAYLCQERGEKVVHIERKQKGR